MIPEAAPPSYEDYVSPKKKPEWALAPTLKDPAMRRAFDAAGARNGWVPGGQVRTYCEREGLMRPRPEGPGVAKRTLACAWELADRKKDARGLEFPAFCLFMHLLAIASAGGALPAARAEQLLVLLQPPERRPLGDGVHGHPRGRRLARWRDALGAGRGARAVRQIGTKAPGAATHSTGRGSSSTSSSTRACSRFVSPPQRLRKKLTRVCPCERRHAGKPREGQHARSASRHGSFIRLDILFC